MDIPFTSEAVASGEMACSWCGVTWKEFVEPIHSPMACLGWIWRQLYSYGYLLQQGQRTMNPNFGS
ncbi:hypothetical protein YC2023_010549 [Brassica napus]